MKKILVTGSNGQLGNELKVLSQENLQYNYIFTDIDSLDITNLSTLKTFFSNNKIDYIVNCAAYTAVDKAEEEKDLANLINAKAVENLLSASDNSQAKLIQISTDYVFGGFHNTPLKENTATKPESSYGISKLKAEKISKKSKRTVIIRTSWLYSSFGHNFVKTIRKYAKKQSELKVVFDQIGTPTYARDLAHAILKIIDNTEQTSNFKTGTYHYANEGVLSWYDFAEEICRLSNINTNISPVLSEAYPTLAKRPAYSVFDKSKIKKTFKLNIPYWKDSLENCIRILDKA